MPLPEDTILENRYRIDRLLAHGGMGAIYRAFDTNLNMGVAIKENFFQTPQNIHQFQQEALILARLRHPGLPRVIHHFSFEGQQYLVMDFIEGEDLWQMVKRTGRPLPEDLAIKLLIQVCDAVSYLHNQNPPIIHRDIKPQNIKITPEGQAVLVDFGIAKIADEGGRTRTGAQAVTPGFSPPEQYSGLGTTPRSDIYSLGATLYAVLTAKKPPDSISLMVSKTPFEPPHVINTALSRYVSEAILHAMRPRSEERPLAVSDWQQELRNVLSACAEGNKETLLPGGVPAPPVDEAVAKALAESTPFWLVDDGGQGHPIGSEPLMIGRHSDSDIIINHASISRHHALIRREGQRCMISDNASANGTFLNGQKLGSDWYAVKTGDVLHLGHVRFKLTNQRPARLVDPAAVPVIPQDEVKTTVQPVASPRPPATASQRMASQPAPVAPAPIPAAQPLPAPPAKNRLLWPVLAGALILILIGGAIFWVWGSSSQAANATATAQVQLIAAQTATAASQDAAAVQQTQTAESQSEAVAAAASSAQAATATYQAQATQTARSNPTSTATAPPATATSTPAPTKAPPTATPRPASPTATKVPATPTPQPATPTPASAAAKPTPAAPAAGPTPIPVQSDVSISEIGLKEVIDVDINLKNPAEVYTLVKADGLYKSVNGGDGPWVKLKVDGSALTAFTISPHNPARLYAPTWNAVLRSDDGGNTWKAFGNGLSTANRVVDVITIDPADPNLLYAGIGATLVVSADGGESWVSEGFGNGLGGGRFTSIVVDPFNHDIVYAAGEFGSIYKSVDSGRTFKQLPYGVGQGVYGLIAHPSRRDVYLAGINSYDAGIIRSDNGADFYSISDGLVFGGADSAYGPLVFAPGNPQIIYAASGYETDANARGIFKSTDGGENWNDINNGLGINSITRRPYYVKAIAVHPNNPDIVLAATGGGLFKSTNGGANWTMH